MDSQQCKSNVRTAPMVVETISDHIIVMTSSRDLPVRVAALKARLSEYLRAVRRGQQVVVYERDTPVARLVPYAGTTEPLSVRTPVEPLHDIPLPLPLGRPVNSLGALLEERQSGR